MGATVEQAIRTVLAADETVLAAVVGRIYPQKAPQNADMPYLVYHRIGGESMHHLGGAAGLAYARIQIDAVSTNYTTAKSLAIAIRGALHAYQGTVTVGESTLKIQSCFRDGETDGLVGPNDAGDTGVCQISQDFQIGFTEA